MPVIHPLVVPLFPWVISVTPAAGLKQGKAAWNPMSALRATALSWESGVNMQAI
jgi:hypothetical protein